MKIPLALHSLTAEGRTTVLDNDLDDLAREHPTLVPVFEETQYLRNEVARLLDDLWNMQSDIDALR